MNERRAWTRKEIRFLSICGIIVFGASSVGLLIAGILILHLGANIKGGMNIVAAVFFGGLTWSAYRRFIGK